jgi:uncharacterized protein YsxB (DUF464 family)
MIEIKFYSDSRGGIHLTLHGHSGASPLGEDLICAACTTLAYTAAQAVKEMNAGGQLIKPPKINIKRGKAKIIATPKKESLGEAMAAFHTVQCGAKVLAHNYPKYVRLEMMHSKN